MTQDEIISLAREAGLDIELEVTDSMPRWVPEIGLALPAPTLTPAFRGGSFNAIERFSALVAKREREACIEDVRTIGGKFAAECESTIRARGEVQG